MTPKRKLAAVVGFKGLDTEAHPSARDAALLQADEGGSHEREGVWTVRRGWTHANVSKKSAAISGVVGLELASGDYVACVGEGVNLRGEPTFDESGTPSSTLLYSSLGTNKRPHFAIHERRVYMTDGWKRMQVWDGIGATTLDAGILGPGLQTTDWTPTPTVASASPGVTVGAHLVRYRYLNSRTGYVSEPSNSYAHTAAGSQSCAFNVGAAITGSAVGNIVFAATTITRAAGSWVTFGLAVGDYIVITSAEDSANNGTYGPITALSATVITVASAAWTVNADDDTVVVSRGTRGRIVPSTDSKADRIVLEATTAGGTTWYKVTEAVASTATTITFNVTDVTLAESVPPWSMSTGKHNLPPIARYLLSHRGRLWTFGQVIHEEGTVEVANGSTTITGTSSDWSDALGSGAAGLQRHPRMFKVANDGREYEIASRSSATAAVLADAWSNATLAAGAGKSYKIYSRDNFIYFSEPDRPESWPLTSYISGPSNGRMRALVGLLNGLLICSPTSLDYFTWTENPATDGARKAASDQRGAVTQRVVINVEERAYGLDRRGFWVFEGVAPEPLSRAIETVVARINWSAEDTFHACWLPRARAIRWWVALDSDTQPKHYLQLDVDRRVWSMGQREVAVTSSATTPTADGVRSPVGDENGHLWFDDLGTTDGADSTPRATVGASSTTTAVNVQSTVTLPTTGTGLTGVIAYFPRTGEVRVITANTSSQITVAALAAAPVYGDEVHFGRIKAKLKTKAFLLSSLGEKHKALYAYVWFQPQSATAPRYALLRAYRDLSSTSVSWGDGAFGKRRDEPPRGTVFPAVGSRDWKVDLTDAQGLVRVPLGDTACRLTELELELVDSDVQAKLLAVAIDGEELGALE